MRALDRNAAKERVVSEVDARAARLIEVSHRIHDRPELLFEERFASDLLASMLEEAGLQVERGVCGLPTAFTARSGGDARGANVAILCEYDALPRIGHGCGHNVIAAAGLGAGLAAASVAAELGGRVTVLGTPAEEGGGGKIHMLEGGAFADVDVALMVHPAGLDLTEPDAIAIATLRVEYQGKAAHAAAFPHRGRNALDAAVLGYTAVAALRQHMETTDRVHGIFSEAGDKPNIVPDHTVAEWYVRSASISSLRPLKERVLACLKAGADAAGCQMSAGPSGPEYSELRTNRGLVELYRANSERLGRSVMDPVGDRRVVASTDMGNVTQQVPGIHPIIRLAPPDVSLHTAEFARHAGGIDADRAVVDGAKAMAMTAVDVWTDSGALAEIRAEFAAAT